MISDHPGQKLKLCLAAHHGNFTPPRISPSCPFQDRSTNAGAVIARQAGHDLLSGRTDPLTTFLAALMQIPLHRRVIARFSNVACQFSVSTWHTSGCFSASGYVLEKVQDGLSVVAQKAPHYLSGFRNALSRKNQKLPIKFIKDFSFDSIFLSL